MLEKFKNRERMANVDVAWLKMDRPTNLMMITAVLMFEGKIDFERFKQTIQDRFLNHKRFKQKIVETTDGVYWETDAKFDINSHVVLRALPGNAGKKELQELAGRLAGTPFDPSKPRWSCDIIQDFEGKDSAAIWRIDHCYADGMALIAVMQSITDTSPNVRHIEAHRINHGKIDETILQKALSVFNKSISAAIKSGTKATEAVLSMVNEPQQLMDYAKKGIDMAKDVIEVSLFPKDTPTRYKGELSVTKRCAWTNPISLTEVKSIGKVLGCTVNDVLLACVSGALRSYLLEEGDEVPDDAMIRASVPVNLRPIEEIDLDNLGNAFGLVFMPLPIGIANPIERLYKVKQNMLDIKNSHQAEASFLLLGVIGFLPNFAQKFFIDMFSTKASAVMTNVPGPREPVYIAGSKIKNQMFWVPQSGEIGMGVSILSYAGKVYFGLITDANLVPDPGRIIDRFAHEFEKLLLLTLLEAPWDEDEVDPKKFEASFGSYRQLKSTIEAV